MKKTLIFVSHSSLDNALTAEVCEQLKVVLGGEAKCEILVDTEKLEDADPWPIQLHEMMADCHAAVVLLSENALKSKWVLKELTILAWRKSLEPGFKLFIAQFPGITDEKIRASGYEPVDPRRIQGIDSSEPAVIADRVRNRLKADAVAPVETLFDRLAIGLADVIEQLSVDSLSYLAGKLGAEQPSWRPQADPKRVLIDSIARQFLRGELGQFGQVDKLIDHLKLTKLSTDDLKKVLRLSAPYWVQAQAAGPLGGLAAEVDGVLRCRAAAINGNHAKKYTGQMYMQRAFPVGFRYRVHGPNPPAPGNTVDHYTKSICNFCRVKGPSAFEDMEDENKIIALLTRLPPWLFVVVDPLDHKALAQLQARFPRVHFMINMGAQHDVAALPQGVVCLLPPVDVAIEEERWCEYQAALLSCAA